MDKNDSLGLGLVGCGAFGEFCLSAYGALEGVHTAAVADVVAAAADRLAERFKVPAYHDAEQLVADPNVDLVHIATPPASHHSLAIAALRAGKHVLCEKPLAVTVHDGRDIVAAAKQAGLIAPVNFVLRYNPVTEAVKAVIDSGVLGQVLSARLDNCAADTNLGDDHWFWDKSVSGGIFVEHGVHFFDLYRYWLEDGRIIWAHAQARSPAETREDRVTCTVRHSGGALASHYHGFDQMRMMDRTDHRLICELGDIRVEGWIPLTLRIDAAVDEEGADRLMTCCPGCDSQTIETYESNTHRLRGRGKDRKIDRRIALEFTPQPDKQAAYAESVRALLADQVAHIQDPSHIRRVDEQNGLIALELAEAAAEIAAAN